MNLLAVEHLCGDIVLSGSLIRWVFWFFKQLSEQLAVHFGSLFITALFDSCAAAPPSLFVLRHRLRKKWEKGKPPKNGKRETRQGKGRGSEGWLLHFGVAELYVVAVAVVVTAVVTTDTATQQAQHSAPHHVRRESAPQGHVPAVCQHAPSKGHRSGRSEGQALAAGPDPTEQQQQ